MTLTVHAVSGAPRPWRVLAGLAFKGLDYDINYLEASKGEHKSLQFLKINPRGTVPVLDADGVILSDSIGILAWLDRRYPGKPLFGETATDAAKIWQITLQTAEYLRGAANDVLFPLLVQGKSVSDLETEEGRAILAAAQRLKEECRRLEDLLGASGFLAGPAPSAADAVAAPEICLIERAIDTKPDDMTTLGLSDFKDQFPKLEAWKQRVFQLPGLAKTMPPHWSA